MADGHNFFFNQEHQYQGQHTTGEDFLSFAQANANYCYQLSLWWWSVYHQQQHTAAQSWNDRFPDQYCECVERNNFEGVSCDCFQNSESFEYVCDNQRNGMNACKDCPYQDPSWHDPFRDEYHGGGGKHHGEIFQNCGNRSYGIGNNSEEADNGDNDVDADDSSIADNDFDEDDESMEVDDRFRKFLEQSEKHRQERELRKQELLDSKDDYVEVGSIHLNTTTRAPLEQPGVKRKEQMETLYGQHASVIMSLETSLQLNYDKHCDMRQPIFWPSIPLKF